MGLYLLKNYLILLGKELFFLSYVLKFSVCLPHDYAEVYGVFFPSNFLYYSYFQIPENFAICLSSSVNYPKGIFNTLLCL